LVGGIAMNLYGRNTAGKHSNFPINVSDFSIGLHTGLGMLGGGILGYAIGSGLGLDEYYNFSKWPYEKKTKIVENILKRNH
jgi:hypothetical protein